MAIKKSGQKDHSKKEEEKSTTVDATAGLPKQEKPVAKVDNVTEEKKEKEVVSEKTETKVPPMKKIEPIFIERIIQKTPSRYRILLKSGKVVKVAKDKLDLETGIVDLG